MLMNYKQVNKWCMLWHGWWRSLNDACCDACWWRSLNLNDACWWRSLYLYDACCDACWWRILYFRSLDVLSDDVMEELSGYYRDTVSKWKSCLVTGGTWWVNGRAVWLLQGHGECNGPDSSSMVTGGTVVPVITMEELSPLTHSEHGELMERALPWWLTRDTVS